MVEVRLSGALKTRAGGRDVVEVEGRNIRELLVGLGEAYPELKPILDQGVAVAVDGQIYRGAWFQPVSPKSEVFILPRMAGG